MIDRIVHEFFFCRETKNRLNSPAAHFETETFFNRETFAHFERIEGRGTKREQFTVFMQSECSV